ncbi:hypothetical protein RFI_00555 [Reticulomyxa filosa]|uniref:PARP catalytic domain-containing protein n=1 Tax=Reticulomyxa filosa TaxID=46433 RepID=X6PFP7_RETFI|nr:hypothetical protein RFI_00555 [Reticulomyxa filosa]|eukprot:ETO36507.1 hypothetical protein RFI_00555 [Reticulomyxa filosa]
MSQHLEYGMIIMYSSGGRQNTRMEEAGAEEAGAGAEEAGAEEEEEEEKKRDSDATQDSKDWNKVFSAHKKNLQVSRWYYCKDNEERAYDLSLSARIEAAQVRDKFFSGKDTEQMEIIKESNNTATVNICETKEKFQIISKRKDIDIVPLPDWWNCGTTKTVFQGVSLCQVSADMGLISSFVSQVYTSVNNKNIEKIELVQNMEQLANVHIAYFFFALLPQFKCIRTAEDKTNEKYLWYGANSNTWKTICVSVSRMRFHVYLYVCSCFYSLFALLTFNQGFSNCRKKGNHGEGVYLYESPSNALEQKDASSSGRVQFLFCVLTTCGETCTESKFNKKRCKRGTNVEFESLVDNESQPTVYVARFENQAYPFLLFKLS